VPKKPAKPTAPGRRERRRVETREKLYRTAMDLFAAHGFFQTTTEEITEAADVGQGTFFNYFPTKSHVLILLSERQIEKVRAALEQAETGSVPIHDLIRKLVHNLVMELGRSQPLARSLLAAFVIQDDVREVMSATLARGREYLTRICQIGQERREVRRDHKATDLAMTFQRSVLGTLLIWAMQSKGDLHVWLEKALADFWTVAGVKSR
jgi:AcrR family transcriptional regulator